MVSKIASCVSFLLGASTLATLAIEACRVEVMDRENGWPVPLVELRTTHNLSFFTDNNGVIACDSPELMNREIWFNVLGQGYEVPKDRFGMRGVRLTPKPGGTLKIQVNRTIIAKRLGRLTGAGIYAESQKTGGEMTWPESGVFGCDSVQNAIYQNKMFWAWGDTTMPAYPLGIFDASSATTSLQPLASFEPPVHLRFEYFRDQRSRVRGVAPMPGSGPTWLTAYTSVMDRKNNSHLVATYLKVKPPLELYEVGLCSWNDETLTFDKVRTLWSKSADFPKPPLFPDGHPSRWTDPAGRTWILMGNPLPTVRLPDSFEAWQDPSTWERLEAEKHLPSASDGSPVEPHSGHIAWNDFRKRWLTIFMQKFGKPSAFGELWYAEAQSPAGPWGKAIKILSHDNYTFYNPRLHPEFTPTNSPILLFEGTYTAEFADRPSPSPRYNYNQVLYRLDLDDAELRPAH